MSNVYFLNVQKYTSVTWSQGSKLYILSYVDIQSSLDNFWLKLNWIMVNYWYAPYHIDISHYNYTLIHYFHEFWYTYVFYVITNQ